MNKEMYLNPKELKSFRIKQIIGRTFLYLFLTIMALYIFIPFYWMIISSLKESWEITSPELTLLPVNRAGRVLWPWDWQWSNYKNLIYGIKKVEGSIGTEWQFRPMHFHLMFRNTVFVGLLTTSGTIILTILAAFAFSRLNFKGKDVIFSIFLMTMMIPGEIYVVGNYYTFSLLGWVRSANIWKIFGTLTLPFVGSVFYTFFLRQTFRQIPNELYLAAKVDGTSDFKYLWKIMIPIASATITTIIILSMIGVWNAFVWPSLVTNANFCEPGNYHLLVSNGLLEGLKTAMGSTEENSILNLQMAGSAMVTVPLLIVFFLCKKYIMRGVSRSGIKG
ncbi:MAG: carbohydrate ABC transporter permease [Bacilli bacterium]|nr:carbohydrate ABC transporter permease [Bacilli bacterium]MDD4076938.1 carbohydrate ABC transporter permease [Bacilli bacterium]MDD4387648.1 carbohydrate ABC transporter permease [Bacilli bacterium]